MKQFTRPGKFTELLLRKIKETDSSLVIRSEIIKKTIKQVETLYNQALWIALMQIETLSAAPKLETIGDKTTILSLDLYYAGILKGIKNKELNEERLREVLREQYAQLTSTSPAEIEAKKVMELSDVEIPGDWKGPLVYLHQKVDCFFGRKKTNYSRNGRYITWVSPKTTAGEVLDNIVEAVKKAM